MKKIHFGIFSIPFLVLVWYMISNRFSPLVFPGPWTTFEELFKQIASKDFYHHVGVSLSRLFIGFLIAVFFAFLIGIFAGINRPFRQFLTPIVTFFQATPPLAWAPLFIMILDLGNAPMIAIIFIASFFPILISVIQGIEQMKITYIRAAQSLGANTYQLALFVYLPAIMPNAFSGIVVGFGIAWRSLVAAEMIGGNAGIGWLIATSGQIGNSPLVMVGIITIGVLAMVFEYILLGPLKKRFASWAPKA